VWVIDIDTTLGGRDVRLLCDACTSPWRRLLEDDDYAKGGIDPITEQTLDRYPWLTPRSLGG
jgi:hypothetical protein